MKRRNQKKIEVLKELEENPIIARACKKNKVSRATFYRWCAADREFQDEAARALEMGRDKINDFAESKLIENISANNHQAIVFWLRHNTIRFRPHVIKLFIEENTQQKQDLESFLRLFHKITSHIGFDEALRLAGEDPAEFRAQLKNELDDYRNRPGEI